jgi:hypothetical protein
MSTGYCVHHLHGRNHQHQKSLWQRPQVQQQHTYVKNKTIAGTHSNTPGTRTPTLHAGNPGT